MHDELKDRFLGSMYGAAIGDALGMPVENYSAERIRNKYGVLKEYVKPPLGHPCSHLDAGQWTDDFQQVMLVAQTLTENNGFDAEKFSKKFAEWGRLNIEEESEPKKWWRYPGTTSLGAARRLLDGNEWHKSGSYSATCGSAMRVAPIGLFYYNDKELEEMAKKSSIVSHTHPAAIAASVCIAKAVAYSADGNICFKDLVDTSRKYSDEFSHKLVRTRELDTNLRKIGTSWKAVEAPVAAIYIAMKDKGFEESVVEAVNAGGDTDSVACMVGAIVGARVGKSRIDKRFFDGLEGREVIEKLATELYEARSV
ncbi:MAG: ADP-ribosylglycohydrolase family protein [Candidatus Aenigmatarchaeota archaeon]